jgi:hypothetical protein
MPRPKGSWPISDARRDMQPEWKVRFSRARSMARAAGIEIKDLVPQVHGYYSRLSIYSLGKVLREKRRAREYARIVEAIAKVIARAEGREPDADRVRELVRTIVGTPNDVGPKASDPLPKLSPEMFLFHPKYPRGFRGQLRRAVRLRMFGTNLRRHRNHGKLIEHVLKKRDSYIEVILCDPKSPAVNFAAFQECGTSDEESVRRFTNEVNKTYRWLCKLKTKNGNRYQDKLNIYKIDYALTFGLDLLEFADGQGIFYLRFFPLMDNERDSDRPIVGIQSDNAVWYNFFTIQWKRHRDRARLWSEPSGRQGSR